MVLKLIIAVIVIYVLYKIFSGWKSVAPPTGKNLPARGEDLVEDPLCHTYIPVSHACRVSVEGKTLYFCSRKCLETYTAEQRKT